MNQTVLERNSIPSEHIDYGVRRYNDTVTWVAEVLPGAMRTPFEYTYDGRELYAGDGSPLEDIFDDAIEEAKSLPHYEQRRRPIEKGEYFDMLAMMRGELPNTMVVESDFPPELMEMMEDEGGYDTNRKPTMLRVIYKTSHGTLMMYSQTLDGSNRKALEEIRSFLGYGTEPGELLGQRMHLELGQHEQEFLTDQLTGVYDRSLHAQFGGSWQAGRLGEERMNTYEFACRQTDLVNAYLAVTDSFRGGDMEYDLAAAIEARYLQEKREDRQVDYLMDYREYAPAIAAHALAMAEMGNAGDIARQLGTKYSGCGATIKSNLDKEVNSSGKDQMEEAGYGNKANKLSDDRYGSRYFTCPKKGCSFVNERPKDKLLPKCKKCGADVSCGESDITKKSFFEIIELSFGKQEPLRKEQAREKAWLN